VKRRSEEEKAQEQEAQGEKLETKHQMTAVFRHLSPFFSLSAFGENSISVA